ncbi:hypothetical protein CC80DRAFT_383167, partial [Byssothecium circinans]
SMSLTRHLRTSPYTRTLRRFTTSPPLRQTQAPSPAPIPYTPTCPSPTCACAPMPPDLDIDRKTPLLNTMTPYAEQVVLCTGKDDWSSRIEDEPGDTGDFIRGLKGIIGRGGEAFDPFTNILLTASSLPPSKKQNTTTALLFPSFARIPSLPYTRTAFSHFASAYLKPHKLHPMHAALPAAQKAKLTRDESLASTLPAAEPITRPVVLICGHAARDKRCGVL